jgi:hypothetical protein
MQRATEKRSRLGASAVVQGSARDEIEETRVQPRNELYTLEVTGIGQLVVHESESLASAVETFIHNHGSLIDVAERPSVRNQLVEHLCQQGVLAGAVATEQQCAPGA